MTDRATDSDEVIYRDTDTCIYLQRRNECTERCYIGSPCGLYLKRIEMIRSNPKNFRIREDQVNDLRKVAEKLDGLHDGCSVILTAIIDNIREHPIDE